MNALHRLVLVPALVLACSGDGAGTAPCGSGGGATSVSVCDNFFAPASSPIVTGSAVTWTWRGAEGHKVVIDGDTERILGAAVLGPGGGEVVQTISDRLF